MDVDQAIQTAIGKLGYTKLKNEQLSAIKGFVSGKDVFVSLPTGYGKSLIYVVFLFHLDIVCEPLCKCCDVCMCICNCNECKPDM